MKAQVLDLVLKKHDQHFFSKIVFHINFGFNNNNNELPEGTNLKF